MFQHPITVAVLATLGIMVLGVFSKAISRASFGGDDLNLGVEAALSAVSGAAIYGIELIQRLHNMGKSNASYDSLNDLRDQNYIWVLTLVIGLIAVACIHMSWERKTTKPRMRFLMLKIFANILGFGMLFGYIYFVKKGL